jgi:hypothetical protein
MTGLKCDALMTIRKLIFWVIFLQEYYDAPTPQLNAVGLIISVNDEIPSLIKANPNDFMDANANELLNYFLKLKPSSWLRKKLIKRRYFLKNTWQKHFKIETSYYGFWRKRTTHLAYMQIQLYERDG